jgi:hypothetical protein
MTTTISSTGVSPAASYLRQRVQKVSRQLQKAEFGAESLIRGELADVWEECSWGMGRLQRFASDMGFPEPHRTASAGPAAWKLPSIHRRRSRWSDYSGMGAHCPTKIVCQRQPGR